MRGRKHPPDCGHCAAIRGDKNPAKRADVRAKISAAASTPAEHARRSDAAQGAANPRYSARGSIKAAHLRVIRSRGRADKHRCSECGQPAMEWALNKDSENIEFAPPNVRGQVFPYSMIQEDYDPLCQSCHRKRDFRHEEELAA